MPSTYRLALKFEFIFTINAIKQIVVAFSLPEFGGGGIRGRRTAPGQQLNDGMAVALGLG